MRPNFLLIQVDQLYAGIMAYKGGWAETPNIDALVAKGRTFDCCTCSFPLCQPSRASLWSGLYPHKTNVLSNGKDWKVEDLPSSLPTLGNLFSDAGYKAIHFGKQHDAGALAGFELVPFEKSNVEVVNPAWPYNQDTFHDRNTRQKAVEFLSSYQFDKPLMMVCDFVNPHNICGYVGANRGVHTDLDVASCPPLPENFAFDDIASRSKSVQYICCSHNRQAQASGWTEENFRHYLAAYRHYLTLVDEEIGCVLSVLEKTGKADNTYILFFSDHGDGLAARGSVTKQVALYRETTEVPLTITGPGIKHTAALIPGLAENLDIIPTLLDLAGIAIPKTMDGISLKETIFHDEPINRTYAYSQWHTEWGFTVSPSRLVRSEKYAYINYLEDGKEELYDLEKDPLETKNVAKDDAYAPSLEEMRKAFKDYLEKSKDPYQSLKAMADRRWRCHEIGYQHHQGPAAPEAIEHERTEHQA